MLRKDKMETREKGEVAGLYRPGRKEEVRPQKGARAKEIGMLFVFYPCCRSNEY